MNESLKTVAARKPVRRGGGGCRSRTLRRSVRETAAAAIGVSENTYPKRPGEEQGGGCLTRQGPRCRSRGEAARDCVFTAEPCRTAAVDRTVAGP